jgi:putative redox protein
VAACVSNDLYREAARRDLELTAVRVRVDSDYGGDPAVSSEIVYDVELEGASDEELSEPLDHVDRIAEIPNSLRSATVGHAEPAVGARPRPRRRRMREP